jgi:hypothetical protein
VAGVSQDSGLKLRSILCCRAPVSHNRCAALDRSILSVSEPSLVNDWDYGHRKGQCGEGRYVAGVSHKVGTGELHDVLCCSP